MTNKSIIKLYDQEHLMGMLEFTFHCFLVVVETLLDKRKLLSQVVGDMLLDLRKLLSQVVGVMLRKLKEHFMKIC